MSAPVDALDKRADPPVLDRVQEGDCTFPRVREMLANMFPGAALNQLIPARADANGMPELGGAENENGIAFRANAFAGGIPLLGALEVHQIRAVVEITILLVNAVELGLFVGNKLATDLVILSQNFNKNPDKSRNCGTGKDAPLCPDVNCQGNPNTLKCTVETNKDCTCNPVVLLENGYPFDEDWFNTQQKILIENAPLPNFPNSPPKCNGVITTLAVDPQELDKGIKDICGLEAISGDPNKPGPYKDYNQGRKENAFSLGIAFKAAMPLSPLECRALFKILSDGCDGNEPLFNPRNLKHGGTIEHPKGAILSVTPKSGANPKCEPFPYKDKNWIDDVAAQDTATKFCKEKNLDQKAGQRVVLDTTVFTSYKVQVGAYFSKDAKLSVEDCQAQIKQVALAGCHGNDPINNPDNKKFGSTFINQQGVLLAVRPMNKAPEYPPDELDPSGKLIQPKCGDKSDIPPTVGRDFAVERYCEHERHGGQETFDWIIDGGGIFGRDVPVTLTVASQELKSGEEAYKQGHSVCRHNRDWSGKINKDECHRAFNAMKTDCDKGRDNWRNAEYVYNCARYSIKTVAKNTQ